MTFKKIISLFSIYLISAISILSCSSNDDSANISSDIGGSGSEEVDNNSCLQQELTGGAGDCTTFLDIDQSVNFSSVNTTRTITSNNIPEHEVGERGFATDISSQDNTYTITTAPELTGDLISLLGASGPRYVFGILLNGIELDPIAAEPWPHNGITDPDVNWDWNLEALNVLIGLDCNYGHVQPTGKYHYHGAPVLYDLVADADGSEMIQIGWAADGFPIYYKYAYSDANDNTSAVITMTSSYQLLTGYRPGDGITAPCSEYNGAYSADYEYGEGIGTLDEANGRYGVTPEFPDGTYYYILTDGDEFPSIPRYLKGTPSDDFKQVQ